MQVVGVDHMVWGVVLGARTLFLLPTSVSANLGWSRRYSQLPQCITREAMPLTLTGVLRECVGRLYEALEE